MAAQLRADPNQLRAIPAQLRANPNQLRAQRPQLIREKNQNFRNASHLKQPEIMEFQAASALRGVLPIAPPSPPLPVGAEARLFIGGLVSAGDRFF